jgi:hypothetical protein
METNFSKATDESGFTIEQLGQEIAVAIPWLQNPYLTQTLLQVLLPSALCPIQSPPSSSPSATTPFSALVRELLVICNDLVQQSGRTIEVCRHAATNEGEKQICHRC